MKRISSFIVKFHIPILIISLALLVPSIFGMIATRINYDMLDYLPEDMETVEGQSILLEDFGKGAFSIIVVEGMENKDIVKLEDKIKEVNHVDTVLWYGSVADTSIPMDILPNRFKEVIQKEDSTLMAVFFDTSTSADDTIEAIRQVRSITGEQCFVTGMSAMVTDLKDLCEREEPIYVGLAVILAVIAMIVCMDSFIVPFIFLASIGIAIGINLGTNIFLGEISYITKALSAVLQLAVTMDYSIFLWNSYTEQKIRFDGDKKRAMRHAISNTLTSVTGSSLTTIAGFIALCFMSFTLGKDLGIVMAKGVILGVIGSVTTLPAMILVLDKLIEKTRHKALVPHRMDKLAGIVMKVPAVFIILFIVILVPAFIGYQKTEVYYDMTKTLPDDMNFVISNTKLKDEYDMASTHMILADSKLSSKDTKKMLGEIEEIDGVKAAIGLDSLIGPAVPQEILPKSLLEVLKSDRYQLILVSSNFSVASDEVNNQITEINNVIKSFDENAMLIGEGPCTKDMIDVTDRDFKVVSAISIAAIFIIIALVGRSISLPIILVAVIEFAIFINLGLPYYTGTVLPFIAPICISTIQLGATVDYAILMTTRYKKERALGLDKKEAVNIALSTSIPSIIISALGFFAATFGVSIYSDIDIISSMCGLMARGAVVSMLSVIFVLPSLLYVCDGLIRKTTMGMKIKG